jgi:hypothetical protein
MSNESIVKSLLGGIEFDDPRLYDALAHLITDLYKVYDANFPPSSRAFGSTGQVTSPGDVTGFIATLYDNNLKLSWAQAAGIVSYEIRYKSGTFDSTDWDTATVILRTATLSADINPLTIPLTFGNHTFLIKTVDNSGTESDTAAYVVVNIPVINSPTVSATVITNFVLLSWTVPTSVFVIDHYNVYKNGVLQGRVSGTFEAIFETVGGTFTYVIEPVDIVNNIGMASPGLALIVSNPVDFTLHAIITSTFTGTKVKCKTFTDLSIS